MSSNNTMPKPDIALKEFFKDNEIYAAVFNGYFFNSEMVINPNDLEPADTAYVESVKAGLKIDKINKYRDNVRKTSKGLLVILGIEDQNKIHYSMPIRKMLYDALGYSAEISMKGSVQDKKSWTVDERLSCVSKGTKVTPIVTVILYTGEDPWDGPRSLHDMMDIDDRVKPFVPDYPLYVIDLGHDENLSFPNQYLEELKLTLSAIYSETADTNETEIEGSVMALAGILAGDSHIYKAAKGERRQKMCKVLEKRDARIYSEFKDQLEENRKAMEENRKVMEENRKAMEEKDAEIAALKAQILAMQK
ncbi:MAG: Rpn family recombination-promoting nuclease/putative transposase [Lachnospiraceae bacterium]|nr:Rpn family recombination-promoting nuclease/putative transposase [Lachnospiraceae bacterium]